MAEFYHLFTHQFIIIILQWSYIFLKDLLAYMTLHSQGMKEKKELNGNVWIKNTFNSMFRFSFFLSQTRITDLENKISRNKSKSCLY